MNTIEVLGNCGKTLDLGRSELLFSFERFNPADWTLVRHAPKWTVTAGRISGGGPDEPTHGQIFYKTPVKGDVVLEFDARIIPPSYHDLVWLWNVRFGDGEPIWTGGYLGCLAGWYNCMAGIEKLPVYRPAAIGTSHMTEPGKTYRIVSGSLGGDHFIAVDGKLVTCFADDKIPDPDIPGYFGFGIFESHAEYSSLKVYRPYVTEHPLVYVPGTQIVK
ncbi:MAG: hypothetical protein PHG96_14785 [Kiritimatiellae bacterium]|nr:hypothetical protein [Kiritimatiellia bacterium]MDD4025938.1 hypothetical protein [Kiritimatiellia bacterium]